MISIEPKPYIKPKDKPKTQCQIRTLRDNLILLAAYSRSLASDQIRRDLYKVIGN
jgi:hypothetical protein